MDLLYDYHVMLTLGVVKVTRGYVKKAYMKSEVKTQLLCSLKSPSY